MAHKVTDACIGCGACEGACPVGAVKVEDGVAVVDAGACIDCQTGPPFFVRRRWAAQDACRASPLFTCIYRFAPQPFFYAGGRGKYFY